MQVIPNKEQGPRRKEAFNEPERWCVECGCNWLEHFWAQEWGGDWCYDCRRVCGKKDENWALDHYSSEEPFFTIVGKIRND